MVAGTRRARWWVALRRAGAVATSEWIRHGFVLDGDPVHCGELLDRPPAVVSAETAVLFTAEGTVRQVVDGRVVHVRHPGLHTLRETVAALDIAREDSGGQAVARLIRHPQPLVLATDWQAGSEAALRSCTDRRLRPTGRCVRAS